MAVDTSGNIYIADTGNDRICERLAKTRKATALLLPLILIGIIVAIFILIRGRILSWNLKGRQIGVSPFWISVLSNVTAYIIAFIILGSGGWILAIAHRGPASVIVFVLAVLLGVTLLVLFLIRPPIAWEFDSFLDMKVGSENLNIYSFKATGLNRLSTRFSAIKCHLVPNNDEYKSDQLQFVIEGV